MEKRETKRISWRDRLEDKSIDQDILRDAPDLLWYALLCPPSREFQAQKILRRHGLRVFVPIRREYRRRNIFNKEKETMEYTAIPRYLFTGFPPGIPLWFNLFNLPLIKGVVGLEKEPSRIPSEGMVRLITKTAVGINAPAAQKYMRTHHEFAIGQTVEVIDGPFEGRKVPVVAIRGSKAAVMLQLFGAEQEIDIAMDYLQAA